MRVNRVLDTDSYKFSHNVQYPKGTEYVHSYISARIDAEYDETLWFGVQGLLKEHFSTPISLDNILEAKEITALHGVPFNEEGWMHILREHQGVLPLRIRSVPEGTLVPKGHVLMTVENTDPKVPWLTSYQETALMRLWYPATVATISHHCKKIIWSYLEETSDDSKVEI